MNLIKPSAALYIKLGEGGRWEKECIEGYTPSLRVGYRDIPHELCVRSEWDTVLSKLRTLHKDSGTATRDFNQLRLFYEADEQVLWVTFFGNCLYWCFSTPEVSGLDDNTKIRPVIGQWYSQDLNGRPLYKSRLSGKILSMQGFRGTICSVKEFDYLIGKINSNESSQVEAARAALLSLEQTIERLIHDLHWKDFEVLVDLIFRQAGWQRIGVLGETEKILDLDLISPVSQERYGVQIKSSANLADMQDYQRHFADMQGYNRLFFVVHSPARNLLEAGIAISNDIELWLPDKVAQLTVKYGLAEWVIDKAS